MSKGQTVAGRTVHGILDGTCCNSRAARGEDEGAGLRPLQDYGDGIGCAQMVTETMTAFDKGATVKGLQHKPGYEQHWHCLSTRHLELMPGPQESNPAVAHKSGRQGAANEGLAPLQCDVPDCSVRPC